MTSCDPLPYNVAAGFAIFLAVVVAGLSGVLIYLFIRSCRGRGDPFTMGGGEFGRGGATF